MTRQKLEQNDTQIPFKAMVMYESPSIAVAITKKKILHGYIRSNVTTEDLHIPQDIIDLCLLFYHIQTSQQHKKKKLKSVITKIPRKIQLFRYETSWRHPDPEYPNSALVQTKIIEILGRIGRKGEITRVRVAFECHLGNWKRKIRNVKGPIKKYDTLILFWDIDFERDCNCFINID